MVDVQVAVALRQHVVSEVRHRHLHMAVPKIDAQHRPGRLLEHELHSGASAPGTRGPAVHLQHHPLLLELAHERVDGRPGKAGRSRYVRLARAPADAQHVEDATAVAVAKPRQRPLPLLGHRKRIVRSPSRFVKSLNNWTGRTYRSLDKLPTLRNPVPGEPDGAGGCRGP